MKNTKPEPKSDSTAAEILRSTIDWHHFHALGLPSGSIRALLAILVFGTAFGLMVFQPSRDVPDYIRDLMFIILGHYFASRRQSGQAEDGGPAPLYLPRGSIRLMLIIGTVGVAALLYYRGQLTSPERHPGVVTLWLVGGFLLGFAVQTIGGLMVPTDSQPPRRIEDIRALVTMAAALILVGMVWNRMLIIVPPEQIDDWVTPWFRFGRFRLEHLLAAIVGFYFGSRS